MAEQEGKIRRLAPYAVAGFGAGVLIGVPAGRAAAEFHGQAEQNIALRSELISTIGDIFKSPEIISHVDEMMLIDREMTELILQNGVRIVDFGDSRNRYNINSVLPGIRGRFAPEVWVSEGAMPDRFAQRFRDTGIHTVPSHHSVAGDPSYRTLDILEDQENISELVKSPEEVIVLLSMTGNDFREMIAEDLRNVALTLYAPAFADVQKVKDGLESITALNGRNILRACEVLADVHEQRKDWNERIGRPRRGLAGVIFTTPGPFYSEKGVFMWDLKPGEKDKFRGWLPDTWQTRAAGGIITAGNIHATGWAFEQFDQTRPPDMPFIAVSAYDLAGDPNDPGFIERLKALLDRTYHYGLLGAEQYADKGAGQVGFVGSRGILTLREAAEEGRMRGQPNEQVLFLKAS